MDPKVITYILMAAFVCFAVYRRVRRSFGRQTIQESRLWLRIAIWTLFAGLLVFGAVRNQNTLAALLGGVAGGALLGLVGLRHTRFEFTPEGRSYTPHTYLGIVVMTLFFGRLLYRVISMAHAAQSLGSNPDPLANFQRSPLTVAIFGLLVSYYLVFTLGVLQKARAAHAVAPPTS